MQEHVVDGVASVFHHLQPIAWHGEAKWHRLVAFVFGKGVEHGQFGHELGRAHVGKQQAVQFAHRVGPLFEVVFDFAAGGFGRGLQYGSVDVKLPAVVTALNALIRGNAKLQRRAPVQTVLVQQANALRPIAKHHQVFTHQAQGHWQIVQLTGQHEGMPVAAQILPPRCLGSHSG